MLLPRYSGRHLIYLFVTIYEVHSYEPTPSDCLGCWAILREPLSEHSEKQESISITCFLSIAS